MEVIVISLPHLFSKVHARYQSFRNAFQGWHSWNAFHFFEERNGMSSFFSKEERGRECIPEIRGMKLRSVPHSLFVFIVFPNLPLTVMKMSILKFESDKIFA